MAPEVIKRQYNYMCDLWSAGVILYIMLSGYPPFYGEDDPEVFEKIAAMDYDFDDEIWEQVSGEAKDLIKRLLTDVSRRISCREALNHPWLRHNIGHSMSGEKEVTDAMMSRIRTFSSVNKMQQLALSIMAHQCEGGEIDDHKKIFFKLDKNNDGYITKKELRAGLKGLKDEEEIERILRAIDTDKNGAISYTEFVAATLNNSTLNDLQRIQTTFEIMDRDGNGYIDESELAEMIGKSAGDQLEKDLLSRLIAEVDANGDHKIDIKEFMNMIKRLAQAY